MKIEKMKMHQLIIMVMLLLVETTSGQQDPSAGVQDASTCSHALPVVVTIFICALIFTFLGYALARYLEKRRNAAVVKPDPEAASRAAYDNPQFELDETDQPGVAVPEGQQTANPIAKLTTKGTNTTSTLERGKSTLERVINAVIKNSRNEKKTKDDQFLGAKQVTVPLQGHDFTGLGFTVHGNLKQGLYIKEVMSRGPASQSGQVVPGDRVIALTVLTDHVVFEDAFAMLSYASPYPVLLHLEKGNGPISGFSTLNSRTKLNSSTASLIHPSFRTQSATDLSQIKSVDFSQLKVGNIMPVISKSKFPSVSITQEVPKIKKTRPVQRSSPGRHSERAIDVPGVEVKCSNPAEVKLDIDDITGEDREKMELANVQVHRPMSHIDLEASIKTTKFEDCKMSETVDNLSSNQDINMKGPKFGVKVFPDMNFLKTEKRKDVSLDMETGEVEVKQKIKTTLEEGTEIPGNTDIQKQGVKPKYSKGKNFEAEEHDIAKISDDEKEGKKNKKSSFKLAMPDISLPTFKIKKNNKSDKDSSSEEEEDKKLKSKDVHEKKNMKINVEANLNIDKTVSENNYASSTLQEKNDSEPVIHMQEIESYNITLPTYEIENVKTDMENKNIESSDSDDSKSKSGKKHFSINATALNLKLKGKNSVEIQDEGENKSKKKSKHGFKMDAPDINFSAFNLKKRKSKDHNVEEKITSADVSDTVAVSSKVEPLVEEVNVSLEKSAEELNVESEKTALNNKIEEGSKKMSKKDKKGFNFKFKGPDFSFPHFTAKSSKDSKENDDSESDSSDKNINLNTEDMMVSEINIERNELKISEIVDIKTTNKEIEEKVSNPDFAINTEKENKDLSFFSEFKAKLQNLDVNDDKIKFDSTSSAEDEKLDLDLEVDLPTFELNPYESSQIEKRISLPDDIKVEASSRELESLELKTNSDSLTSDIKIPQITSPDLGFEDDKSNNGKHERGESSDYEMNAKLTEISIPKWSLKSNSSYDDSSTSKNVSLDSNLPDIDTEILDDESSEDLNITDATKKKRYGIKIPSPDIVIPEFLKTSKENQKLIAGNQSDEMKSFNLKLQTPTDSEGATSLDIEDKEVVVTDIDDIIVRLPRIKVSKDKSNASSNKFKYNKSDEWKIKSTDTEKPELNVNAELDDANFVIPDIKSIPGYKMHDLPEIDLVASSIDNKNLQSPKSPVVEYTEFDIKKRRKIFESSETDSSNKSDNLDFPRKQHIPDFHIDIPKAKFLGMALDVESDLPEADSDLKRASLTFPTPDYNPEETENKDHIERLDFESSPSSFGNAFGFQGFKKHIQREEIKDRDISNLNKVDKPEDTYYTTELEASATDLPEVDIHLDLSKKLKTNIENNEQDFEIQDVKVQKENIDELKSKMEIYIPDVSIERDGSLEINNTELKQKITDEDDKVKAKSKKGLGFGFKGFGKSSDSEENEASNTVSNEPEGDDKERARPKAKKTFSFKGLVGRSLSDTDEDNAEKVNDKPSVDEPEEKVKLRNKSSLTFGFKQRSSRSSDSEDNNESERVDVNPNISKKQKHKSESMDDDAFSTDTKVDDGKIKGKYGINFGFKRGSAKNSSDSEGMDTDEHKINLDERVSSDKNKEQKNKSIKLGFKGFKNLKGKIQNEINKMRHDSPSTDEEEKGDENYAGDKRKKISKKKEKEKMKRDSETIMDASEEAAVTSAAFAAKESRRKRIESKGSSPSSSDSSSEDETKVVETKKKKKIKNKRKEEIKVITTTTVTQKNITFPKTDEINIEKSIAASERTVDIKLPSFEDFPNDETHITVVQSQPSPINRLESNFDSTASVDFKVASQKYVVVREMKLKQNQDEGEEVTEIFEKKKQNKKLLQPVFLEDRATLTTSGTDTDGANWGSDSDMERRFMSVIPNDSDSSVNLIINKHQRHITDSEELKRKAASLGDLSQLHEGLAGENLLERAVSLDLKNASVGHPSLHIRRLQLPDSSATSIDEVDEALSSPKKSECNSGLKAASQWGTLEEALRLGIRSNEHIQNNSVNAEGAPISNIEISGDPNDSSQTFLISKNAWIESFEDDKPPSLPLSPVPLANTTTITVKEKRDIGLDATDSNIVVLGNENDLVNIANRVNIRGYAADSREINTVNTDSMQLDNEDASMVTITMVPAESHVKIFSNSNTNLPPELISYDMNDTSIVTVSHENGEDISSSSDHNISDDFIIPDSAPQKSMTQITLEGDGGYTVTEGPFSRTVIISNPEGESNVSIVQTEEDNQL